MVNTQKLRGAIVGAGLNIRKTASSLGLSSTGFHNKLHNETEFKASEIYALIDLLHIDPEQIGEYFFDSKLN